ncbi:MAG: C-terminal processing peptidase-3 [Bacteroidetes bacterium]|nr:C-terminal processing peptidase-3 [Bacteroidota bacterium]
MKKIFVVVVSCAVLISQSVFSFTDKPSQKTFRISKNQTIFNSVLRELDAFYVDSLNYDKMMKSAVDEMLSKLDPYTVYMPEEETDELTFLTTGEYAGIGAVIMKKGNDICISDPYEGMPAQRADIRAGDIIVEVDGKQTKGMDVSRVSSMLKGAPNTQIKLKLQRFGEKKLIEKTFLRERIQVNPVAYSAVVADKTGYVLLTDFTDKSANELKNAVNEMVHKNGIESLIIDLRNNGGGLVDEAVKIAGYFMPKGTEVVTTKGKNFLAARTYRTPTEPLFPKMKLTVLVNRGSASASEILAGAIQDIDRGVVIGERTFGKGLVQNIRPVGYGGHLKITTAKYYIPSGRCIQAIDYSHRNEDGSIGRVPDSLTTEFTTRNGRKVRDGGGIVPDIVTTDDRKINIAYYIFLQNHYFDFATRYKTAHATIEKPQAFNLSDADFKAFVDYLKEVKFAYTTQTQKYFNQLEEVAEAEGLSETAKAELAALKAKLNPDIDKNLLDYKKDIAELLSNEIIKRYYFQKGEIEFSLRNDQDLKTALAKMADVDEFAKILIKK